MWRVRIFWDGDVHTANKVVRPCRAKLEEDFGYYLSYALFQNADLEPEEVEPLTYHPLGSNVA